MSTFTIVMIVILVILIGVLVGLYIFGKKAEKKQAEQQEQMAAAAQVVSMLIIDKKKLRLKEAGLPQMVVDNTPKYLRRTKVPVVKAKIGAKIMTLMCENKVFEVLPVKKEVKAVVSGLYITEIKSVRGGSIEQPEKKKDFQKIIKKQKNRRHEGIFLFCCVCFCYFSFLPDIQLHGDPFTVSRHNAHINATVCHRFVIYI